MRSLEILCEIQLQWLVISLCLIGFIVYRHIFYALLVFAEMQLFYAPSI